MVLLVLVSHTLVAQTTDPIPACKSTFNASLGPDGMVTVVPEDLDNGSLNYDHLSFSSFVLDQARIYSCDDLEETFELQLWATSTDGDNDYCICNVTIIDEVDPTILCPMDIDISCNLTLDDIVTGEIQVSDNCSEDTYWEVNVNILEDGPCGIKRYDLTWTGYDASGNSLSCTQYVNRRFNANGTDIQWPDDIVLFGECGSSSFSGPTFSNDDCSNILVIVSDEVMSQAGSLCGVLKKTWTVVDQCSYQEVPLQGWWQRVQTIEYEDTTPPTIFGCTGNVSYSTGTNCNYEMNLYIDAVDQCFAPIQNYCLIATHIESRNTDTICWTQNGQSNVILTPGNYILTWIATDACGNADSCIQSVEIIDKNGPKIEHIIHGWEEDAGEMVVASDIVEAYDDCQSEPVEYWIQYPSLGPGQLLRPISAHSEGYVFNCEDIGLVPIDIWMEDGLGNQSYTTTYVNVRNDNGNCESCEEFDLVIADPWYANVPGIQLSRRANTIMSTSQIHDDVNLLFATVEGVVLESGFEVMNVSDFQIIVDECDE